ncbi:Beta-amyrin 28-oxidase [Arachis hypogaea]|uniref:Beta-amyrin 28-oxidase n=1 Tax=Arachis hypogaea TaxID=3818 RepID=A0A444ZX40_ARAHY|nr:Beta-amyrin 28-oxidase [Arachis hypogaea]RYR18783.1 hypothetical protein Ahy_B03g063396 isoform A [Arachis hypogaea]
MTETEIIDNLLQLLFSGHNTTRSVISSIMKYLGDLPEVYEQVLKGLQQNPSTFYIFSTAIPDKPSCPEFRSKQMLFCFVFMPEQLEISRGKGTGELLQWEDAQKMKYSWNVASEVMRLSPPVNTNFKEAIRDFNYAGYTIPKGWKLRWATCSTHMDPEYFPNPEAFDASRFEGEGPTAYSYVPFGRGPRMCLGIELARLEIPVFMHHIVERFKWDLVNPDEKFKYDPLLEPVKGLPVRLHPRHV